jgi:hypothetical protein
MRGLRHDRMLAGTALSLMLAAPLAALAQESDGSAATFNERFSVDPPSAQQPSSELPKVKEQRSVRTATHAVAAKRPRSRVVVAPRSFLDAGTEVRPGERKFLNYAFSPLQAPLNVVTNTGGRVGWHNSPLPGPLFPYE